MSLSSFVEETLVGIVEGVEKAVERGVCLGKKRGSAESITSGYTRHQKVEFDMAVTVTSENKKGEKAGIGIQVLSAFLGGELSSDTLKGDQRVTRLRFAVPIEILPEDESPKPKHLR